MRIGFPESHFCNDVCFILEVRFVRRMVDIFCSGEDNRDDNSVVVLNEEVQLLQKMNHHHPEGSFETFSILERQGLSKGEYDLYLMKKP